MRIENTMVAGLPYSSRYWIDVFLSGQPVDI
jgi:hypothetical protein